MPEMPDAQISQSHQSTSNLAAIALEKKPSPLCEPQEAHVLIVEDDNGSREFPLGGDVYSLGRDPESDIRLFSLFVSRRHATLVRREHEDGSYDYEIVDGNLKGQLSANGILINGQKLQAHTLKNEDEVEFGPGVSAKYLLKRKEQKSGPLDPFDITLINPSWVDEEE
jgi:pSer/pThr/pTyr-binding forkhead associated (FHA) protein